MSIFYLVFSIVFAILFFVTLIEYLTGAEREGIKFFVFLFIFVLVISLFFSLKSSEILIQRFSQVFASLLNNFGIK